MGEPCEPQSVQQSVTNLSPALVPAPPARGAAPASIVVVSRNYYRIEILLILIEEIDNYK